MDIINMQFDIELSKANNMFEYALDNYYLECKQNEIYNDMLYMEDAQENVNKGLIQKLGEFIEKIIAAISKFVKKIISKFTGNKKNKELVEALSEAEKNATNTEKIEIYDETLVQKELNEYIQKVVVLERKLMSIKVDIIHAKDTNSAAYRKMNMAIDDIKHELDKLDEEYNSENIKNNKELIKMAKKDAIRFGKKELQNVEVDFEEYKKGSEKVLRQFKKDANGCNIPVKVNLLKRMINSISTKCRKSVIKKTEYRTKNIGIWTKIVLTTSTIVATGATITTTALKVKKMADVIKSTYNDINTDDNNSTNKSNSSKSNANTSNANDNKINQINLN